MGLNRRIIIGIVIIIPAIGLLAMAILASWVPGPRANPARWWSMTLVVLECISVAILAPFWATGRDKAAGAFARLGMFQAGGTVFVVGTVFIVRSSGEWAGPVANSLVAQVVVFSFGALLIGLTRISRHRLQLPVTLLALLMMGTTFYCNPLVEAAPSAAGRDVVISAVLRANPLVMLTESVYNYRFMRGGPDRMYDNCVIGPYYPFTHPDWRMTAGAYALLGSFGVICGRRFSYGEV